MKNKKLYAILGLSAIAANLGYSSLVFAQTVSGTQTISCGTVTAAFLAPNTPSNFSYSAISIPTKNYTMAVENVESHDGFYIQANAQEGCTNQGLSLKVRATDDFKNGTIQLVSNVTGRTAILSLANETSGLAGGAVEWSPITFPLHHSSTIIPNNAFTDDTGSGLDYLTQGDPTALLIDENGCVFGEVTSPCDVTNNAQEMTLMDAPAGFYAQGTDYVYIAGIYYDIAIPHSVSQGTYQASVLWTLSTY